MYRFLRPLVFKFSAETAHDFAMSSMGKASRCPNLCSIIQYMYGDKVNDLPVNVMGLDFRHPIGLAAGLDKGATAFKGFAALGFSGVEMGTVTPKPQSGNDKPRMFRLEEDGAIINRMGFNSSGLDDFLSNLDTDSTAIAGINIGKNKVTPNENAIDDYLQAKEPLDKLLKELKAEQLRLSKFHNRYVPIALKIAPDLSEEEIEVIATLVKKHQFDALIATNTTLARPDDLESNQKAETGGLSGAPLKHQSTEVIASFYKHLKGEIPIIGVGGIETVEDAWDKLLAGADYLQVYSGLIYHGPEMIQEIVNGLKAKVDATQFSCLSDLLIEVRKS